MDSDSGDLLIKFVIMGTRMIKGASQTVLTAPGRQESSLVAGFKPDFMTEIDGFDFRCGTSKKANTKGDKNMTPEEAVAFALAQQKKAQEDSGLPVQPVSFNKAVDISSAELMMYLMRATVLESASIIKRKPTGSNLAGEVYMRLDFTDVLINKVDWSDEDDYIKEKVTFIARSVKFSYRAQQQYKGVLSPVISNTWTMDKQKKA
jgi:type VI protein secretion system component Hcp